MNIRYSDNVKQSADGFELVQKATNRLEEVVGPKNAPLMSGEWDQSESESAQGQFTLRLKNPDGEAAGRFELNELQNPHRLSFLLRGLWDDLLRQRIDRLMREFREGDS